MAIDDNTSYELTGAQVKDFTAKIKNSVGGADKLAHLVYMVPLTINEGNEIAAQIDDPDVHGTDVTMTCIYGFLRAKDGVWLDRLGVGGAISNGYNFVFVNNDVSYNDAATIVKYTANWDDDEEDCYPTFVLCGQTAKTPFGNSKYTRIDLGANSNTGLSAWYHPVETSWKREPDYVIQRMTSTEATEIANQINEEQGSTVVSGIEVRSAMIFTIRNTTTGKILKYGAVKNMLQRGGNIMFLPDIARGSNYEIMSRAYGSSSKQSFILRDFYNDTEYEYILKNPSAESSNLQYMWYLFDHEDLREGSIDVFGVDDSTSIASAPDSLFQVAYDSSDNLYMAVGDSSAADWKQINNDAITAFTGTDGTTAGTSGLVPAPAAADSGLFLKSDGTWDAAGSSSKGVDTFYGTCGTQYYTGTKDVTTSSDFELKSGVVLFVKFTYYNTQSSVYLRVNNGTSKLVYANGDSSTGNTYMWKANDVVGFVYDGTYWRMVNSDRATSSYWGKVKLASSYTASSSDTVPTSSHLYSVYNIANGKQDQLIAGQGISISGNTISATSAGSTYTYSGAVDTTNNSFTTTITDQNSNAQNVTLNAGSNITFSSSTALGKVGPTIVPNTTAAHYADITSLTFTPTNANLGYFFVLRVYKEYQMASGTNMYQATLYLSNTTYNYSSAAEVSAAINNEQIIVNPDFMAFSNYFTQINQSSFQSDAATAISQVSGVPANFGGTIDNFGQATYVDVYVYVLNESAFTISATGGSGGGAVTYYMTSGTTQGIPSYQTYIYSDAARTTVVDPDTILAAYESGNTILLKYESTQTGSSAYDMTLQVNSMSLTGEDGYKMLVSELNADNGNYNAVNTLIQATWNGTGTFSGRWVLVRNIYNKNALIIREWS